MVGLAATRVVTARRLVLAAVAALCCWRPAAAVRDYEVEKVYVVFSNHFDAGYTKNEQGSCAGAVLNQYFHEHIPKAIRTGRRARAEGGFEYRWLTQSWIIDAFLHCDETPVGVSGKDLVCPTAEEVAALEEGVRQGWISWHAFPFNAEPELFTPELFDAALNLTFRLDDRFGQPRKRTLSQRDVPGLSRAAVPLLARRGVRMVSVGENMQIAPVNVPPIFVWKDLASGSEVLGLFHANGYGRRRRLLGAGGAAPSAGASAGSGGLAPAEEEPQPDFDAPTADWDESVSNGGEEVHLHVECEDERDCVDDGPSLSLSRAGKVVSSGDSCVTVAAAKVAVCTAWKQDNEGPHAAWQARLIRLYARWRFPNAEVLSSRSFDDFADAVWTVRHTLPVVTQEIGDTWIYGASSDPLKVAQFRAASRLYGACMREGGLSACLGDSSPQSERALRSFERQLMMVGEHTWGYELGHIKYRFWENAELAAATRADPLVNSTVGTWLEQRAFIAHAVASLPRGAPLAAALARELAALVAPAAPPPPPVASRAVQPGEDVPCGDMTMRVGGDGGLHSLRRGGAEWASPERPLMRPFYQGYDHEHYHRFAEDYIGGISRVWIEATSVNLVKPLMLLDAIHSALRVEAVHAGKDENEDQDTPVVDVIVIDMAIASIKAHEQRGAPARMQARIRCDRRNAGSIDYTLMWFNKTTTHVPETIWLTNTPALHATKVLLDKLGAQVDAEDVDLHCDGHAMTCGVHLHAVGDGGAAYVTDTGRLRITAVDSAVLSVGPVEGLPTPLVVPDIQGGLHWSLTNNLWNTNYPVRRLAAHGNYLAAMTD
jgi:hypothetical protein